MSVVTRLERSSSSLMSAVEFSTVLVPLLVTSGGLPPALCWKVPLS